MNILQKSIRSIMIWGDSLLKGVVLDEQKGRYTTYNKPYSEDITEQTGMTVVNKCVFGCTATKGAQRLDQALRTGIDCDYALIEYGGNDCDYDWSAVAADPEAEHECNTPLEKFMDTYREIIHKLRRHAIEPLLMTLPPIDAQRYFEFVSRHLNRENILKWLGDISAIYRQQESYSLAITQIAREEDCRLIDVRTPLLQIHQYSALLCADGIHLNNKGHQVISRIFVDFYHKLVGEGRNAAPQL